MMMTSLTLSIACVASPRVAVDLSVVARCGDFATCPHISPGVLTVGAFDSLPEREGSILGRC